MINESKTILIIDDEPIIIEFLQSILEDDYTLRGATNAFEGLALARAEVPDLILLDISMPEVDGYELCATLKKDQLTRSIPIIFITALTSSEHETKGLKAGAVDYIAKPINPDVVKARVGNHMELKKQRDYLESLAMVDSLTGILNRRGFDLHYDREWRRSARSKSALSLIMIDIDDFKLYNDNYGHLAGDDCLKQVAKILKMVPRRGGDVLVRYGGEEFLALLPDTPFASLQFMAERFRAAVEEAQIPHCGSSVSKVVTVSIGAATAIPDHRTYPFALVDKADQLLYRSKTEGRNRVFAEELTETHDTSLDGEKEPVR